MSAEQAPPVLWEPGRELLESAEMTRFMHWLGTERGVELEGYEALWRWSVDELEAFWAAIWDYFSVEAEQPYERVLGSRRMPGAEWFTGARLSYPQHIFRGKDASQPAIHHASELRDLATMSWGELRDMTARIAGGLRALGVQPGDRVVAYMPNVPETIAAFLACASIGAVWSSCSPDFGARSVVDRFAQIEPKVLLAVDGYRYNGRDFDRMDVVRALQAEIGSLEATIVMPYLDPDADADAGWSDLLASGEGVPLDFEQLPFDHPLWVLYSSGTTGLPKAIVHGQGGILLEHLKKLHRT